MAANGNLLLGILAVQLDFISQAALLETMNAWLVDKSQSLGQLLMERGFITSERLQLLSALVSEHVRQHDNDPEKSLAALPSIESTLRQDLAALPDADVHATMIQYLEESPDVFRSSPLATD